MTNILIYWFGIIGIEGKGPAMILPYDPNKTIGEIISNMSSLKEFGKRIEIWKFKRGDIGKYDKNDPYWNHKTKLSEYVSVMGLESNGDLMLIYVSV